MTPSTAITVHRSHQELQRLWSSSPPGRALDGARVRFRAAPGDRGTEIHVDLGRGGRFGHASLAKDELRRFKQHVETGEIARSDGTPEGERAERKLKQRPAQPLAASEFERAGVR